MDPRALFKKNSATKFVDLTCAAATLTWVADLCASSSKMGVPSEACEGQSGLARTEDLRPRVGKTCTMLQVCRWGTGLLKMDLT